MEPWLGVFEELGVLLYLLAECGWVMSKTLLSWNLCPIGLHTCN